MNTHESRHQAASRCFPLVTYDVSFANTFSQWGRNALACALTCMSHHHDFAGGLCRATSVPPKSQVNEKPISTLYSCWDVPTEPDAQPLGPRLHRTSTILCLCTTNPFMTNKQPGLFLIISHRPSCDDIPWRLVCLRRRIVAPTSPI